ncbi:MAG: ribosomal protein [Candidatus Saccharibacteria bacterium]|nr:ribosomal protein [Candidatus Saccharibacteria bacterium]
MAQSTKAAAPSLPKEIFAVEIANHQLLKLAYESYLAKSRLASATTKTRGEVRGGGKKPWKQKGTGRARFGSSRNPIWKGGGIVFGPLGNENYTKKISVGSKRTAVRQALTLADQAKKVHVFDFTTTGKTAEIVSQLDQNKFERSVLIVVDEKTPELLRATNNLQNVTLVRASYLNVFQILNADHIVIAAKAIDVLKNWLIKEEA